MGFFDEHPQDTGGGVYVKADEKAQIAEGGIPFRVLTIFDDADNVFQGKAQPRFVLNIELPDAETGEPEERKLPFPKGTGVDSRDKMLAQMAAYLERDDAEEVYLKLEKVGRAFVLRPGNEA